MAGSATFFPSEADYVTALAVHYRSRFRGRRLWRLLTLIVVLAAALGGIAAVLDDDPLAAAATIGGGVLGGLGAIGVFMLLGRLLLPRWGRRLYRQQRTLHQEHSADWDDTGIAWRTPRAQSRYDWGEFHRWRGDEAVVLIYLNDHLFHFVPLRALDPATAADLRATLAAHGPAVAT